MPNGDAVTVCSIHLREIDDGQSARETRMWLAEDQERVASLVAAHQGTVVSSDEREIVVVFGSEAEASSLTLKAIACAIELLEVHEIVSRGRDSANRMAIGIDRGDRAAASRLGSSAAANELLISEQTRRGIADYVETTSHVGAYRVIRLRSITASRKPIELNFGKYELLDRIGSGGMGDVYRARRTVADGLVRSCALKLMRTDGKPSREAIRRFIEEAKIGAQLRHPNVVELREVGRADGQHWLDMELVEGGTLQRAIATRDLYTLIPWTSAGPRFASPLARMIDVAIGIAAGLDHSHRALDYKGRPWGIVHRDVKSANVLFDANGVAKVSDFGLAGVIAELHRERVPGASPLVSAGGMTAAYASPEQIQAVAQAFAAADTRLVSLTSKADVWSWAVTVLEMFTGGVTWLTGAAAPHVLASYRAGGPPPGIPIMPPGVEEVLRTCFARDPDARPELRDVIDQLSKSDV